MCNIIKGENSTMVFANNGKESKLFESLIRIPFITDDKAISLYIQATSKEFLDNNLVLDENYEPKVFFSVSNGNIDTLYETMQEAMNNSVTGGVKIVFAKEENTKLFNDTLYSEKTFLLGNYTGKEDVRDTNMSRINNMIIKGILNPEMMVFNSTQTEENSSFIVEENEGSILDYIKSAPHAVADYLIASGEVKVNC